MERCHHDDRREGQTNDNSDKVRQPFPRNQLLRGQLHFAYCSSQAACRNMSTLSMG